MPDCILGEDQSQDENVFKSKVLNINLLLIQPKVSDTFLLFHTLVLYVTETLPSM